MHRAASTQAARSFQSIGVTRGHVLVDSGLTTGPESARPTFRHGGRVFSNGITMTFSRLTQLAQDLRRKGLSLAEIAIELGTNSVRVKRLLQPELYNALEPINDAPINSMRKYLERRRGND